MKDKEYDKFMVMKNKHEQMIDKDKEKLLKELTFNKNVIETTTKKNIPKKKWYDKLFNILK